MPSLLVRLILVVWCLCASSVWGANGVQGDVLVLDATRPPEQLAATIAAAWEQQSA